MPRSLCSVSQCCCLPHRCHSPRWRWRRFPSLWRPPWYSAESPRAYTRLHASSSPWSTLIFRRPLVGFARFRCTTASPISNLPLPRNPISTAQFVSEHSWPWPYSSPASTSSLSWQQLRCWLSAPNRLLRELRRPAYSSPSRCTWECSLARSSSCPMFSTATSRRRSVSIALVTSYRPPPCQITALLTARPVQPLATCA